MNRKAFLLGFFSIGGQVLLLRELVSSLNGDELFISTALFSWLGSVAIGSFIGGKNSFRSSSLLLLISGIIILPASIIAIRLSPVIIGLNTGEIISFVTAALISICMMLPTGLLSGALFSVITREGYRPAESIARVYLFEGIGAFVGGIIGTALVGSVFSTLSMAVAIGLTVIALYILIDRDRQIWIVGSLLLICLLAARFTIPLLDTRLDAIKYKSFGVGATFDTHYGHEIILDREDTVNLLTDNTFEASYPDPMIAENILIPPLIYRPDAKKILYIGRTELGIMQLADSFPNLKITAIDPRNQLTPELDKILSPSPNIQRIDDDPVAFFSRRNAITKYDIIIINSGEPDNYKNGRFLSEGFLITAAAFLVNNGILYIPSRYDSDRYLSPEKKELLSIIDNSLNKVFRHTIAWPGDMTLFFASNKPLFDLPQDSIIARSASLKYKAQFINADYLADRLQPMKTSRLEEALKSSTEINTLNRPTLIYRQAIYRSNTDSIDRKTIPLILNKQIWLIMLPALFLLIMILSIARRQKQRSYGLFLFFIAGFVSLSLELISFYVYQSSAGSLYSELGALIGVFMLGLALGTLVSLRMNKERLEYPALLLLLTSVIVYMATYADVHPRALLYYYLLFMFTIAIATGSLFVAAAGRYYYGRSESNRGLGYTCELLGSSVGALAPTIILLPIIGLHALLIAIAILLALSLVGAVLTG